MGQPRALVIDDEPVVVDVLRTVLDRGGHEITAAEIKSGATLAGDFLKPLDSLREALAEARAALEHDDVVAGLDQFLGREDPGHPRPDHRRPWGSAAGRVGGGHGTSIAAAADVR